MKQENHDSIKVGILGCGHWGANYVRLLNFIDEVTVEGVCDNSKESVSKVQRQYPHLKNHSRCKPII